jgi:origin recognition complex subunit 4
MASLLALLSHPSEIIGTDEGVTSQSIVFVIDEFDMFASHPRQTLLYNLFDIAQSRKAPIAVVGCTTRLDVVEMLEKRVKSRFSHRYVYLSLPKSLPAYWQVCRQGLIVDSDEAEKEGINTYLEGHAAFQEYWNNKIEVGQILFGCESHTNIQYRDYTESDHSRTCFSIIITQPSRLRHS